MSEQESKERVRLSFKELIEPDWFKHPEKSTFWLQIYEFIMPPDLSNIGKAIRNTELGLPIKLTYGELHDFAVMEVRQTISFPPGKKAEIHLTTEEVRLPDSNYVIMTCPFRIDTGQSGVSDPARVKFLLDCFAGLFRSHLGMNALWRVVHEGERYAHNGVWATAHGPFVRWPQAVEGPDYAPDNWSGISDVAGAVATKSKNEQQKLFLALRYLNRGCEQGEFMFYWTTLEVLCGSANKIRGTLWKAYKFERQHDVDAQLYFNVLKQWRHDLVHRGKPVVMSAEVERYLQCLILDLIRHVIGLDHRAHAATMRDRLGLDLS